MISKKDASWAPDCLLTRRTLLTAAGAFAASQLVGCGSRGDDAYDTVDAFISDSLQAGDTPGVAACVVRGDQLEWSTAHGWADIAARRPMTVRSIQNIASVSKTVTATAVMQLWEEEKLSLDEDVNGYLSFPVRNPRYPDMPITIRQLLTHTSSITDGPAYEPSYACGDPTMSLLDWLQAYFDPGGVNYDAENNFLSWEPGTLDLPEEPSAYSNLGFGLLGGIVEVIAKKPFASYCEQRIFEPLAMKDTGWCLAGVDKARHAVPYGAAPDARLPRSDDSANVTNDSNYHAHCLYSFTNYPDGLVRTSVDDLSKFLRSYIGLGQFQSARILREATIERMLTASHDGQGLCWRRSPHLGRDPGLWGHGGSDPGVRTTMDFRRTDGVGVIVFSNYDGWHLVPEVAKRLFAASLVA